MKNLFIKIIPHLAALALFILINTIFFYPQLEGFDLNQYDTIESVGKNIEVATERRETGRQPLWTNSIFGGMPSFFNGLVFDNYLKKLERLFTTFYGKPIGVFFLYMLIIYIALLSIKIKQPLAILGALGYGMATNNLILYEAGHMMKVGTLIYSPLLIAGVILMLREKYISGALLYLLGFGMSVMWHHVQMTYYLYLCFLILGVIYLINYYKSGKLNVIAKVFGLIIVTTLLGLATNTSRLWTSYEYSQETMRGQPILQSEGIKDISSSTQDGLDWEYAMSWSNNTLDLMAALVPGMVGGGSGEVMRSGATFDALRRAGQTPQAGGGYALPTYWGALPFTSGPIYLGAVLLFLFVLGMFLVKGPLKWWLGLATLLTALISLGKNFTVFNQLLFDYFPMFNKFRTPNSVLSVTTMFLPILAALGLMVWNGNKHETDAKLKALLYSLGITGGTCLLIALLGPSLFTFESVRDADLRQSGMLDLIVQDRKSMMRNDAFRSLFFILAAGGLLWLHLKGKLKFTIAVLAIAGLVAIDFWGINRRYVHPSEFTLSIQQHTAQYYQEREVDRQIKSRETSRGDYRVLDLSINTFNTNKTSFHHNTIGGYSPAKLQRYQDMIDYHIGRMHRPVLNMLNTKYIIDQNQQLRVNPDALGPVWFVSNIQTVNTSKEEIDALSGDFNPAETAFVLDREFNNYISGLSPSGEGTIRMTQYNVDSWAYEYSTTSEQLAVFSEIWYKPDKGLKAFVNGEEVPFIRANYCLRAIKVPSGSGTIEFRFEPRSYILGRQITLASSGLLVALVLSWIIFLLYKNKEFLLNEIKVEKPKNVSTIRNTGEARKRKK